MKKFLSLILALLLLAAALASCTTPEVSDTDDDGTAPDTNETVELTYTEENGILLSGKPNFRIVYEDGLSRVLVQNIRNRINFLDESDTKYEMESDKDTPEDGAPEILVGNTNRAISKEAKEKLQSPLDYCIMISGNQIAIFALSEKALTEAVLDFKTKLVANEIGQVFYPTKEDLVKKVTSFPAADLTILGEDAGSFSIVTPEKSTQEERIFANELFALLTESTGKFIDIVSDSTPASKHEILIGNTNRAESSTISPDSINVGGDFRLNVTNGKLVVAASSQTGYNAALHYLKELIRSDNKAITSAHVNRNLSVDEIKAITVGAGLIEKQPDGLYFYKCTQAQMAQWKTHGTAIGERATHSTGIRLDFHTSSKFLAINGAKVSTTFELHINGSLVKKVSTSTPIYVELDTSKGENRISLIFPSNAKGALSAVYLSDGATVTPVSYDVNILFHGDSITQGVGTSDDTSSFAHAVTKHFNANSIIQGVGGGVFDANTIDTALNYDPDYIIVAFGCNDWARNKDNQNGFHNKLKAYLDKLEATYPDATVICITPIPRLDYNPNNSYDMTLEETRTLIESECAARGYHTVKGTDMLPADRTYYADDLHPNTKGFTLYGENLCKALESIITKN